MPKRQQSPAWLPSPLPATTAPQHTAFYRCPSADIAPSACWPHTELGRTKEAGFNNCASQNDPSRKVTGAGSAQSWESWHTCEESFTALPLALVLQVGKGPELSSASSLSECRAALRGAGQGVCHSPAQMTDFKPLSLAPDSASTSKGASGEAKLERGKHLLAVGRQKMLSVCRDDGRGTIGCYRTSV